MSSSSASASRLPIGWILLAYGVLLAAAATWSILRGDRPPLQVQDIPPMGPAGAAAIGCLSGLVAVWLSHAASLRFAWARRLERAFATLLGPLSTGQILLIAAASSIGEEAFFRGALQPWLGLPLTSLVFGVLHVGPSPAFLPWTAMAIVMGFVLGLLFAWTGSLIAPVLCHGLINGINLRRIAIRAREESPPP